MALNNNIKKGSQILKAVTQELPTSEKWYQDRMDVCNSCEFNSRNDPKAFDNMTILEKAGKIVKDRVCDSKEYCTACGCCVELKCSLKESVCGLSEIGEEPKWDALEVKTSVDNNLSIVNLTPSGGKIYTEISKVIYDFEENFLPKLSAKFQIVRKGGIRYKKHTVGCSCTVAKPHVVDKDTVEIGIEISTLSFVEGLNKRTMRISYYDDRNRVREISVTFKINKK